MPEPRGLTAGDAGQALRMARLVWAALIAGQGSFMAVIVLLRSHGAAPAAGTGAARALVFVAFGLMMLVIPIAHLARRLVFGRARRNGAVPPPVYLQGTIAYLALCETVGLFGLVTVLVSGSVFPAILPTVVAIAVQAANRPTGNEMFAPRGPGTSIQPE